MSVTTKKGTFGGTTVTYEARVDELTIASSSMDATAQYVYVSYCRTDDAADRPVIFAFNGGPGSASVWTHLGLGPRHPADADLLQPRPTPPFALVDNPDCLLDAADLVFIDPPGTGFSRVLTEDGEKDFYGLVPDAIATLRFIAEWTRHSGREQAPKFLLGESYGAMRAAAMAKLSTGGPTYTGSLEAIGLTGVMLVSPGFHFTIGDVHLANTLPSLAATAWYHQRVPDPPGDLAIHVEAAQRFAATEYLPALYAGYGLDAQDHGRVAEHLHALTGIPVDVVREHDLRLDANTFADALLSDEDRQLGIYDGRYTLPLRARGEDPVGDDPAMGQYVPSFASSITAYLRDELHAKYDDEYRAIEFTRVNSRWDYGNGPGIPSSTNHAIDLATAMRRNRDLQLLVCVGVYDLATTLGGTQHALSHAPLDASRVRLRTYESGHMLYLGAEPRQKLATDLRKFLEQSV